MLEKKKLKNNRLLISFLIITALLSLSIIIIYQYEKYNQVENRLKSAYSSINFQSTTLYKLFSTFSEAEYLFRMYSINFKKEDYDEYTHKLDSIKTVIDSLSKLPIQNNPIIKTESYHNKVALEYLNLKKQVDHLVLYAKDTIVQLVNNDSQKIYPKTSYKILNPDSIINNILKDSTFNYIQKDTIIKEKENLFHRIFKAKNDTLINDNVTVTNNKNLMTLALRKNLAELLTQNNKINSNVLKQLRISFEKLQSKERELLFANYMLLNSLKNGIERLRQLEYENYKKSQESDFLVYNANTKTIKTQLFIALSLMILMVVLIISYQSQVYIYERKLIKEKKYADQIAEEKTSVLANISHEIRSPINSLKGLVNIIKSTNSETIIDKEIIQSIDHDITVINSTINDILSLSKLESESLQIKNEHIIIFNLIEDLVSLHSYHSKIKGLEMINENSLSNTMVIHSNPFRIKQIVSNLITNAIKYTEKGSILINSEILDNKKLIVKVKDTGIGISKEQEDQIFRKYYVADNKNKVGGFGLGLYISKLLSEQIGASLSLTSTIGQGTTFVFELPLSSVKINVLENPIESTIKEIPDEINIVFIDDSKINLFFVQQLFKSKKNVHFFIDANKALEYIKSTKVDIVITDLKMPKISGWQVLNIIKSNDNLSHIKVFVSTAEPLLLESNNGNYQFDGIINKPIKECEIVTKILSILN